jgi:hypothetical protein
MGMFDYVRIETRIPGYEEIPRYVEFQTKSFENLMDTYAITIKGELYVERWSYDFIEASGSLFGGYVRAIDDSYRREYLTDFHGDVIFYEGIVGASVTGDRVWRDYTARFTEGKLTKVWYTDSKY